MEEGEGGQERWGGGYTAGEGGGEGGGGGGGGGGGCMEWERGLPATEELTPLNQTLIDPLLAHAFSISEGGFPGGGGTEEAAGVANGGAGRWAVPPSVFSFLDSSSKGGGVKGGGAGGNKTSGGKGSALQLFGMNGAGSNPEEEAAFSSFDQYANRFNPASEERGGREGGGGELNESRGEEEQGTEGTFENAEDAGDGGAVFKERPDGAAAPPGGGGVSAGRVASPNDAAAQVQGLAAEGGSHLYGVGGHISSASTDGCGEGEGGGAGNGFNFSPSSVRGNVYAATASIQQHQSHHVQQAQHQNGTRSDSNNGGDGGAGCGAAAGSHVVNGVSNLSSLGGSGAGVGSGAGGAEGGVKKVKKPGQDPDCDDVDSGGMPPLSNRSDSSDDPVPRTLKRPRLVWTPQLHKRFVDAVSHLGIKNAVPKTIMQLMNVEGLTRENVASHLQKYRLYLKRLPTEGPSAGVELFGGLPQPRAATPATAAAAAAAAAAVGLTCGGVHYAQHRDAEIAPHAGGLFGDASGHMPPTPAAVVLSHTGFLGAPMKPAPPAGAGAGAAMQGAQGTGGGGGAPGGTAAPNGGPVLDYHMYKGYCSSGVLGGRTGVPDSCGIEQHNVDSPSSSKMLSLFPTSSVGS